MRRTFSCLASVMLLFLSSIVLAGPAGAQVQIGSPTDDAAVKDGSLLERGERLENEHRWGEALTLYEDALRERPGEQTLNVRHDLAKIHYDLGRRYSDSSFRRAVSTLREQQALTLYGEVLLKIQSHYVTEPAWQSLVQRGTTALELALREPAFQKQNVPAKTEADVEAFCRQLRRTMQSRTVRNRQDAIDSASAAGRLAQQQINLSATAVVLEFTAAAAGGLDEYSCYLTSDQLNDVYSQIEGNFVGLGIELKASDGALLIVKVISGSPAARAGIKPGDRITSVNGRPTADLNTDQAADMLQGEEGSQVEVTAQAANEQPRRLALRREHVDVPSVDDVKIIDHDNGIGYLKLTCFQKTTSRDLDAALWRLHREGMKSLIMDLRGNPGGLLTSAVEVADKFVDDGTIVSTRGRNTLEDYKYTAHRAGTWHVPLVVLIDSDSASASEIFAGAIHDNRCGTIVGQRSYGKGSVQGIFPLSVAGCGVRLTTAKFYSPSGQAISHAGVTPNVIVQQVAKPVEGQQLRLSAVSSDETLDAGLKAAKTAQQQTARR